MPDAIESKSFRAAARRNCIEYLGIPVYVTSIPELHKMALPTFRAQTADGAISQLMSTLVNMSTQIELVRAGLRMTDSKAVPGVTYGEINDMSMGINGPVYFENASQYAAFVRNLERIGESYGWARVTSKLMHTSVYRPAKAALTNIDPAQAAVKGMLLASVSDVMDAETILTASDSVPGDRERYFEARDRYGGGSVFKKAAIQYYSNTPTAVHNAWSGKDSPEVIPTLKIEGRTIMSANLSYMPTSVSATPGAFVQDDTGFYPTRCDVTIQMSNPLGGLFANFKETTENNMATDPSGAKALIPENYLPKLSKR